MSRTFVVAALAVVVAGTPIANADPRSPATTDATNRQLGFFLRDATKVHTPQIAIAINPTFGWTFGKSLAGSAYVGLTRAHAIRANAARYDAYPGSAAGGELIAGVLGGGGDGPAYEGRIADLGLGWMYFPNRLWHGLSVELGLLVRDRVQRVGPSFDSEIVVETDSTTIAGRALVGLGVLALDHFFVSIAVGLSVGRELGRETTSDPDGMTTATDVSRGTFEPEGFLRVGGTFGL